MAVLKKNYVKLCECLPQDYIKTVGKVKKFGAHDKMVQSWRMLPSYVLANESITGFLIFKIKSDYHCLHFCDRMKKLTESRPAMQFIDSLRHGKYM